ncbi:MAG: phosphoadenosine phosphosulfate reductase family protein [Bacteroidaceae bacterium]|nr:phosphoadenosine phosphosulfate reductase family protein [Bacteroidaceae bacterium]
MTLQTLQERQRWTLPQKIDHSLGVIEAFASWFEGRVYVSFSGGKDSVAMLSLVEMVLPKVKCMFIMTGCESPSVCRFIREQQQYHDIDIVRPEKTLRQVFAEYGFPLVSKRTAHDIESVRRNPYCESSRKKLWRGNRYGIPERWMYLLNEPYQVSARCCFWLKHQPAHEYTKRTGLYPYLGLLASESRQRTLGYVQQGGCNVFEVSGKNHPRSLPLAIWTDDDVWAYIKDRHLKLPDIYEQGARRTGCMGCGFGAHLNPTGIDTMRRLWPKWYDLVMSYENNGIPYGDALAKAMSR